MCVSIIKHIYFEGTFLGQEMDAFLIIYVFDQ